MKLPAPPSVAAITAIAVRGARLTLSTIAALGVTSGLLTTTSAAAAALDCPAEQPRALLPRDPKLCAELAAVIRDPSALPLAEYEARLGDFLRGFCHRDRAAGWKRDKSVRDTGPYTARLVDGEWVGQYHGTHAPVVIWYSPEMLSWLKTNRPADGEPVPDPPPVPDGAVMVKEMYPAPAALCAAVDPTHLLPSNGAAVMVRDNGGSHDGWYWGWFGWPGQGWDPDYPAGPNNRLPFQGFGQYCMNCHASARDDLTFASLKNVEGEPGEPLAFLSQHFFAPSPAPSHHRLVTLPEDDALRLGQPRVSYDSALVDAVPATSLPRPSWGSVAKMPSQTYDNTWVAAGGPTPTSEFVTSDQCLGCHDAGGTGLQFDMTAPDLESGSKLLNFSPYATWRSSPMGLGGRDPIFFAMLASETETFHPKASPAIQNICLGCHGITGQRQFGIDTFEETGACEEFLREHVDAIPYPPDNPRAHLAEFGALARDGISCTACHHMLVGEGEGPATKTAANRCVVERQQLLNPEAKGFARTFTGSFLVGPPGELYGPFEKPKVKPMEHALGITPVHDPAIRASELCGSCHTVHLPVMADGQTIARTYEQTTYPEWAFSDYRTGSTPQGELPLGAGPKAESCQSCHMESKDAAGKPLASKIAGIQEHSSFPQAEYALGTEEIDLPVREGFARHTLVGLNVFFLEMAQQFPDILGIRTQDPMLVDLGVDPLILTEQKMLDQATNRTAEVAISDLSTTGDTLRATVTITSHTGHKLPSGVGFRRAFVELAVLDDLGQLLWASGRTNDAGLLVDGAGEPLPGELWWKDDCSGLLHPDELVYQPHYQKITGQDQVQIYQELVTAPPDGAASQCGLGIPPRPPLTTSFLSICGHVKDNRILPSGFLSLAERTEIAEALGAGADLARDSGPHAVDGDPDYVRGGGDSLTYEIDLSEVPGRPAAVRATLYYQAIPPYFLQDRFCTSKSDDTQRLYFLAGHVNLEGTAGEGWKLLVVGTGEVALESPR